jgi:hypothetical protein
VCNVFVIGPDEEIKLILVSPMTTGRNFDEALHVVDRYNSPPSIASQRPRTGSKAKTSSSSGAVTDEAKRLYPCGWKALKPYMRRAATAVASPLSLCFVCESAASAALFVLVSVRGEIESDESFMIQ